MNCFLHPVSKQAAADPGLSSILITCSHNILHGRIGVICKQYLKIVDIYVGRISCVGWVQDKQI